MNRRLARLLLRSYRPEWRAQYNRENDSCKNYTRS